MNEAKTQLDAGNLNGAVAAALTSVKSSPTDVAARTFLFELSCFSGDWERAEKQLEVISHQDAQAMIGAEMFKQNFHAERNRQRLISDGLIPECLMNPPKYVEELVNAHNRIREGNLTEARQILDQVEEVRPAFPCKINGEEHTDFRDYNDLTCCVFEAIVKGTYAWIPFEQVVKVKFIPPKSLRDLFWMQAEVEMTNGTNGEMFLPTLYANSYKSDNDQVRLGRMTDWQDVGEEIYIGEGLRQFWCDGQEKSILELSEVEFLHSDE